MLAKLGSRFASKKSNSDSPFIFTIIKKCQKYGISYDLMCRLHYNDLLYLIIEYDIENIKDHIRMLEKSRQDSQGITVVEATNEDILNMHRR